jgi:hypothetical protein
MVACPTCNGLVFSGASDDLHDQLFAEITARTGREALADAEG